MGNLEQWGPALAIALMAPVLIVVMGTLLAGIILQRKRLRIDTERFAAVRAVTSGRRGAKPLGQWKRH